MTDTMVIEFSEDLLCGADEISKFLFGDARYRRRVYYLAARSKLPIFRLRSQLCARKSSLIKYVKEQETRHTGRPSSDEDI
jgi:hypothetical protein